MMKMKNCRQLWFDYAFLTSEMKKYVSLSNWILFEDLERQRELLQVELENRAIDDFRDTTEGKELVAKIIEEQKELELRLGTMKRLAEQQRQRAGAYDGTGAVPTRVEREV